jgi:hypothetical protein
VLRGAQARAAAGGEALGKAEATAQVDLPGAVKQAEDTKRLIDDLVKHPGLPMLTGTTALLQAQHLPGTDAFDANARLDQLIGKQFLEAYQLLKGGGQITEVEGKKATDSMSRMRVGVSEAEFKKAAQELKDVLDLGISRIRQKAGGAPAATPAAPAGRLRYDPATQTLVPE